MAAAQVEAVARLALLEDFDVRAFDGLCVALLGDRESPPLSPPEPGWVSLGCVSDKEAPSGPSESPHGRLCAWLLRLCEGLLDPAGAGDPPEDGASGVSVDLGLDGNLNDGTGSARGASRGRIPRADLGKRGSRGGSAGLASGGGGGVGQVGEPAATSEGGMGSLFQRVPSAWPPSETPAPATGLSWRSGAALRFAYFEEHVCVAQVPVGWPGPPSRLAAGRGRPPAFGSQGLGCGPEAPAGPARSDSAQHLG